MTLKTEQNIARLGTALFILSKVYDIAVFSAVTYVILHFVWKFW